MVSLSQVSALSSARIVNTVPVFGTKHVGREASTHGEGWIKVGLAFSPPWQIDPCERGPQRRAGGHRLARQQAAVSRRGAAQTPATEGNAAHLWLLDPHDEIHRNGAVRIGDDHLGAIEASFAGAPLHHAARHHHSGRVSAGGFGGGLCCGCESVRELVTVVIRGRHCPAADDSDERGWQLQ